MKKTVVWQYLYSRDSKIYHLVDPEQRARMELELGFFESICVHLSYWAREPLSINPILSDTAPSDRRLCKHCKFRGMRFIYAPGSKVYHIYTPKRARSGEIVVACLCCQIYTFEDKLAEYTITEDRPDHLRICYHCERYSHGKT